MKQAVGRPIYSSAISGAEYPFEPVKEGDRLEIGQAILKFVETPGHTPDGMSGYVYSKDELNTPKAIFTGDAKFVGGMGRPDLIEGTTSEALASKLFDTWTQKLSQAGDSVVIFPAHGAGSLCGAHLSDQPYSTVGAEKQNDPYAQILEIMRKALRPSANTEVVLTVCGYRFGDAHINTEIDRALRESRKALTVVVFTEMETPKGKLREWLEDEAVKDQVLIYAKRGFFHGSNSYPSADDLPWWKFENLTRLLGGVR